MEKTCPSCGYQRAFCQCGRKRNSSGKPVQFQNYDNSKSFSEDFAVTSRFRRPADKVEKKFMEELNPTNNESVTTWIDRSSIAVTNLNNYAHAQHLFMTSKGAWACHKTSRYCFICTSIQHLELLLMMAEALQELLDISQLHWNLDKDSNGFVTYTISKL